jgi:hypothetical protein
MSTREIIYLYPLESDRPTFEEIEQEVIWRKRFAIFLCVLAALVVGVSLTGL